MLSLKQLKKNFRKQVTGIGLAAATAVAPLATTFMPVAANAQSTQPYATQNDVNDFIRRANELNRAYPNLSTAQVNRTNALYVNYNRFFLDYDGQNYAGSVHRMGNYATYLANEYGLRGSSEYNNLMRALDVHSRYAETYLADTSNSLVINGDERYFGMKYQAIIDIQRTSAEFIERVIPLYERNQQTHNRYVNFGRACYMTQVMSEYVRELNLGVSRQNGHGANGNAMTLEYRGRDYTCPPPNTNSETQTRRNDFRFQF